MFQPDYPIVTARLLLRPFVETDLDSLHALYSRDDVTRYLYTAALTRSEAAETLQKRMRRTAFAAEGDAIALMVEERDTGALIGDVVLIWNS